VKLKFLGRKSKYAISVSQQTTNFEQRDWINLIYVPEPSDFNQSFPRPPSDRKWNGQKLSGHVGVHTWKSVKVRGQ